MRKIGKLAAALLFLAALFGDQSGSDGEDLVRPESVNIRSGPGGRKRGGRLQKDVVLDAGHGGRDPGKVGEGGVLEKDLNLAIAKETGKILKKKGIRVVYTRTADEALAGEEAEEGVRRSLRICRQEWSGSMRSSRRLPSASIRTAIRIHRFPGFRCFYYEESREGRALAQKMEDTFRRRGRPDPGAGIKRRLRILSFEKIRRHLRSLWSADF